MTQGGAPWGGQRFWFAFCVVLCGLLLAAAVAQWLIAAWLPHPDTTYHDYYTRADRFAYSGSLTLIPAVLFAVVAALIYSHVQSTYHTMYLTCGIDLADTKSDLRQEQARSRYWKTEAEKAQVERDAAATARDQKQRRIEELERQQ